MTTYRNKNFVKRDYEATNIVCCEPDRGFTPKGDYWVPCDPKELKGLTMLYREAGIDYYGYM